MDTWLRMTACDLGRGIGAGEIDPVALAETYLNAIATQPQSGDIYARTTRARALAEAEAARKRAQMGHRLGLLDGVPISWKDLFDTADIATEAGSALLEGRVPAQDAAVVANATAAGLVCLGKTHMSELAFSGLGVNPITATAPNVHDLGAAPGGSSSGAAASVAFDLAAAGIGSDTAGSVRVPAAWNDLVGLKTTSGLVSLEGVVPLIASFDTVGPLCRSVEDAGALLAALEGKAAPDLRGASLKGARFAVLETLALEGLENAPAHGFDRALTAFAGAGAVIERIKIPEVTEALDLAAVIFSVEAYATWKAEIEAAPEKMFAQICERFRGGAAFSGVDFVQAWQRLREIRAIWTAAVAGYDAVVLPTVSILPPQTKRLLEDEAYYVDRNLRALRNTRIGNLMGVSGLTLPTGVPSVGVSLLGAPMAEHRLLRLGQAAEAALA